MPANCSLQKRLRPRVGHNSSLRQRDTEGHIPVHCPTVVVPRSVFVESCCLGLQHKSGGNAHPELNTCERPIAKKYREGKMKRTLKRELKVLEIVGREAFGGHGCASVFGSRPRGSTNAERWSAWVGGAPDPARPRPRQALAGCWRKVPKRPV